MILLGLDSAGAAASAAIWRDGVIVARRFAAMARGQAEALPLMVAELAGVAAVDLARLDGVCVTVGPGSFTGIRIGLALARGFGVAADAPVVGLSSFMAIAHDAPAAQRVGRRLVVVLESKRAELYAQLFDADLRAESAMLAATADAIAERLSDGMDASPVLVAGDAADRLAAALAGTGLDVTRVPGPGFADAASVAALGAARLATGAPIEPARPIYLRPPDVTMADPPARVGSGPDGRT